MKNSPPPHRCGQVPQAIERLRVVLTAVESNGSQVLRLNVALQLTLLLLKNISQASYNPPIGGFFFFFFSLFFFFFFLFFFIFNQPGELNLPIGKYIATHAAAAAEEHQPGELQPSYRWVLRDFFSRFKKNVLFFLKFFFLKYSW